MKKILAITVAVFMFTAGAAMAFETDLKGYFDYRYRWQENPTGRQVDADEYGRHDMDMRIEGKIKANDNSWANIRLAIHDEEWGKTNDGWAEGNRDADITVERAWLTHQFPFGLSVDAGLMGGGAWGTSFGDNVSDVYRVKLIQSFPMGKVYAIYQKNAEAGAQNDGANDSEDNDSDTYILGAVVGAGPVKVMPLFVYTDPGDASATESSWSGTLALAGKFGMVGFEAEGTFSSADLGAAGDSDTYRLYGNVYANVGPAKVGGWVAYMPVEDGRALDLGADFGYLNILIGDNIPFQAGGEDVEAATAIGLYADISVGDALTISPKFGWYDSEVEGDDTSAWEIDLSVSYKISDALTYTAFAGYADWDIDGADPDGATILGHRLKLSF